MTLEEKKGRALVRTAMRHRISPHSRFGISGRWRRRPSARRVPSAAVSALPSDSARSPYGSSSLGFRRRLLSALWRRRRRRISSLLVLLRPPVQLLLLLRFPSRCVARQAPRDSHVLASSFARGHRFRGRFLGLLPHFCPGSLANGGDVVFFLPFRREARLGPLLGVHRQQPRIGVLREHPTDAQTPDFYHLAFFLELLEQKKREKYADQKETEEEEEETDWTLKPSPNCSCTRSTATRLLGFLNMQREYLKFGRWCLKKKVN